ncbi:MAG: DUF4142 domain-containing protein [Pseudomonadota bacterium]|nr:DUF4142 domain-containing protein [Pseudomonadota bacterium]
MMKRKTTPVAAAIALGLFLAGANAQTGSASGAVTEATRPATAPTAPAVQPGAGTRNTPTAANTAKLDRADRKFILKTAEDGMYEVEVAKLATSKATSQDVKAFASMMVEDHTKANSELAQLANAKGVELPAGPPHGKRLDIEKMGKMEGAKFDKAFAHEVGIEDHQKDIKMFEKGSKKAKDAELKAWIDKTLPTLRTHLAAAAKLPQNNKTGKS